MAPATNEFILLGIENPLLDISAVVTEDILAKYGVKANDAILAEEKHKPIYEELVRDFKVQYIAGGAAQNALRGAQWLLPPRSTVYFGAVGKDKEAEILAEVAGRDGLRTEYQVVPELPTGKCAVLITGTHRALVTDLLAANAYKPDHLERPEIWALVEQARFYYVGGYFLTVSPPAANKIARHAAATNKVFTLNISAPFIAQFFTEPLKELLQYADVVFGNEAEAEALSTALNFGTTDLKEIALKTAALPKANGARARLVVYTHGAEDTVVAFNGVATVFPIIAIKREQIVDTNGAGDAFVGGFLSQFVQGHSVERSVAAGHYVANVVIQRSGPSYPAEPHTFTF
ncbi:carbohydrate kinase PfkB [Entophlyctis helioformis]|nr:carbohydrate kinase PfkB [Entophlyctis helioformis]